MSLLISAVEIVNVLQNDPELIKNWVIFATRLGLNSAAVHPLRQQFSCGNMSVAELFLEIVTTWVCRSGRGATVFNLGNILEQMEFQDCAEKLQNLGPTSTQIVVCSHPSDMSPEVILPIRFGVGRLVNHFTGRQKQLHKLTTLLDTKSQVVILSGFGGIGKTELTKKFISQLPDNFVVAWLFGATADTLMSSLATFCDFLGVPPTEGDKQIPSPKLVDKAIANLFRNFNPTRFVIVIDNVDDKYPEFIEVTRALISYKNSLVVVTSRRKDIFPGESKCVGLSELKDREAIEFVKSALDSESDHNAQCLCQKLQNFPLALQQATAYIQQQQLLGESTYDINSYLIEFDMRFRDVLGISMDLGGYEKTTLTVWDVTIDKMRSEMGSPGKLAYALLEVLAHVNPDGINVHFLKKILATEQIYNDDTYSESLKILSLFSLIRREDSVLSLHRLVQKVTRHRLGGTHPSTFLERLWQRLRRRSRTADFLLRILKRIDMHKVSKTEMPHVLSLWGHFLQIPIELTDRLIYLSMLNEGHEFVESNLNLRWLISLVILEPALEGQDISGRRTRGNTLNEGPVGTHAAQSGEE